MRVKKELKGAKALKIRSSAPGAQLPQSGVLVVYDEFAEGKTTFEALTVTGELNPALPRLLICVHGLNDRNPNAALALTEDPWRRAFALNSNRVRPASEKTSSADVGVVLPLGVLRRLGAVITRGLSFEGVIEDFAAERWRFLLFRSWRTWGISSSRGTRRG